MLDSITSLWLIGEGETHRSPDLWIFLVPASIILVLYMVMDSPARKERNRRELMLKNLKKTDRVVTIGGIFGSVVNISADGKEVTLKVDDSTRIKFRRTAIAEVFSDETPETTSKTT